MTRRQLEVALVTALAVAGVALSIATTRYRTAFQECNAFVQELAQR